ncbi:S8 family peptidase [Lewinella sp. W8]|uniref:S8 family peptidase n=1 Tax=Lewinella sp. W8 TaxID=2528208 RepID=UPI001566FADF|nr:S8 family peptidase [Lewinella sp. W8]
MPYSTRLFATLLLTVMLGTCVLAQGKGTRALEEVKLDQVYSTYDLDGTGVLVIMLDRGIDYHHPAYLNADGTTRLAYVFDMIAPHDGNPYGVGTILDEDDINGDLMTDGPPLSNDNHGHGTATTGIIAGSDAGLNNNDFGGVAPGATIISVKFVQDGFPAGNGQDAEAAFFDPTYIAIALEFARDKIEELGLPSVTLMNIGSLGGPADGSSSVSRAIADFAEDHPFVCGVGDDGGQDNVTKGTVSQGQTTSIRIQKMEAGNMDVDLWYSGADRFRVRLTTPNGVVIAPATPGNNAGTRADGDGVSVWHNGTDQDFYGSTANRREVFIRIPSGTGVFTLELTGNSVSDGSFIGVMNPGTYSRDNKFLDFATNESSINDYSATPGVISPADYVLDPTWRDIDNVSRGLTGQGAPGEIWIGSSKGPTQDGRLGIDFAAPGEVLFGPYSANSFYARNAFLQAQGSNGLFGVQNAVSAAAPLSTGVIALMLQLDPTLTPADILTILQESAREDGFTGSTPNNTFGHGKLDAKAALDEVNRIVSTRDRFSRLPEVQLSPNPVRDLLTLTADAEAAIQAWTLTDLTGRVLREVKTPEVPTLNIPVAALPNGTYFLRIHTRQGATVRRFVKQ